MYTIYDISKYIYLVYDMPTTKSLPGIAGAVGLVTHNSDVAGTGSECSY